MSKTKKRVCRKVHQNEIVNNISNQPAKTQPQTAPETTKQFREIFPSSGYWDTDSQISKSNEARQSGQEALNNGDSNVVISVVSEDVGTYQIPLSELSCLRLDDNGILNLDTNSFNFIPTSQKEGDSVDINSNVQGTRGDNEILSEEEPEGILNEPKETNTVTDESVPKTSNCGNVSVCSESGTGNKATSMEGPDQQSNNHLVNYSSNNSTKSSSTSVTDSYSLVQDDKGEGYMLKVHAVKVTTNPRKRTDYSRYNIPMTRPAAVSGNTSIPVVSSNAAVVSRSIPNPGVSLHTNGSPMSRNIAGSTVSQRFPHPGVYGNTNVSATSRNITGPTVSQETTIPIVSQNATIPEIFNNATAPVASRKDTAPTVFSNTTSINAGRRNVSIPSSSNNTYVSSAASVPLHSVTSGSGADGTFSTDKPFFSGGTYPHSSVVSLPVKQATSVSSDSVSSNSFTSASSNTGLLESSTFGAERYVSTGSSHKNLSTALPFAKVNHHPANISLNNDFNSVVNSSLTVTAPTIGGPFGYAPARAIPTQGSKPSARQDPSSTAVSTGELVSLGLQFDKNASVSMGNFAERTSDLPSGMNSNMSTSVVDGDDFDVCSLDYQDNQMYQERSVVRAESSVPQHRRQIETGHRMKINDHRTRQTDLLRPFCDCDIEAFSPELARGMSYMNSGSQMYLMHASSVIIGGKQLVTFEKEGHLFVSVAELRTKNLITNLKRFTYLLKVRDSVTNLDDKEMEFLIQKKCIDNKKQKRCLSLDHLRWIYKTQVTDSADPMANTFAQIPWYVLRLGHWCSKVASLKGLKQYVCPICHRVEYRPIQGGSQDYACAKCSNQLNTQVVAVPKSCSSHVMTSSHGGPMTSQHASGEQVPPAKCGHLEITGKYVCAYKCGENTYVNCRHLMTYLSGFPWENFVDLAMSLKVSFLEAPLAVVGFFTRRSYACELLMGKVWCSLQDLRCISCFSVGQMNNSDFLVKNQMLALIAQHQYKEMFPNNTQDKRAIAAPVAVPQQPVLPTERVMSVSAIQASDIPVIRAENQPALQSNLTFPGSRPQPQIIIVEDKTQIPTGTYHVRQREAYKDIERDDGKVVYRFMNAEPRFEVPSTSMDLLSIATKEIMTSASCHDFTGDLESDEMLEFVQSTDILSVETRNDDTCMSQITNSSRIVQMNNSTTFPSQNLSSIADINLTGEDYQNMSCESLGPEPKQDILSMPNSFFENSPQTSKKKKHFLSPTSLGQLSAKGIIDKEPIVIRNENGEVYECTPLCLVHELESGYLAESNKTPLKNKKSNPDTSNPKSVKNLADSLKAVSSRYENSPDSGISDGRSELCTPGSKTAVCARLLSLHQDSDTINERSEWCTPESQSTKDCQIQSLNQDQHELDSSRNGLCPQSEEMETSEVSGKSFQQKNSSSDVTNFDQKENSTDVTKCAEVDISVHVTTCKQRDSSVNVTTCKQEDGFDDATETLCLDVSGSSEEFLPSVVSTADSLDTPFTSPTALTIDLPSESPAKKDGDKDNNSINLSILASVAEIASPYEVSAALGDHDKSFESATTKEQEHLIHHSQRTVEAGMLSASDVEESSTFVNVSPKDNSIGQPKGAPADSSVKFKSVWNESVLDLSEKSSDESSVSDPRQEVAVVKDNRIATNNEVDAVETPQEQTEPKDSPCDTSLLAKDQGEKQFPVKEKSEILKVTGSMKDDSTKAEVGTSSVDSPERNTKDKQKSKGSKIKDLDKESENLIQLGLKLQDMIQKQSGKHGTHDTCLHQNKDVMNSQDIEGAKDAKHEKFKKRKKTKRFPTSPSDCPKHESITADPVEAFMLTRGQISGPESIDPKMTEHGYISKESSSPHEKNERLIHEPNKTVHKHRRHKKGSSHFNAMEIDESQYMGNSGNGNNDQIDFCNSKTDDSDVCKKVLCKKRKRTHSSKGSAKKRKTDKGLSLDSFLDSRPKDLDEYVVVDSNSVKNQNVNGANDSVMNLLESVEDAEDLENKPNQNVYGPEVSMNLDEDVDSATDVDVRCANSVTEKTATSASLSEEWWKNLSNVQKVKGILNRVKVLFLKETADGIQFQRQVDPSIYKVYGESEAKRQWLNEKLNRLVQFVFLNRKYKRTIYQKDSATTLTGADKTMMKSPPESASAVETSCLRQAVATSCGPAGASSRETVSASPSGFPAATSLPASTDKISTKLFPVVPRDSRRREKSSESDPGYQTIEVMVECETESPRNRDSPMSVESCEISPGSSVL